MKYFVLLKNIIRKSNQINHEFIDINKNDEFLLSNNITSLNDFYSLLVIDFIDIFYTLFICNHKMTIFPLILTFYLNNN